MKGFVVAEQGHIVNILPPVDITGGKTAQAFSMKNHGHATIILQVGVSAAAFTKLFVNKCSAADGSGATAIPFSIYTQETAGADKDVVSARVHVDATGYSPSPNDNIFYVIEVDAAELDPANPYVELQLTNGANSVIASAVAILTAARFASAQSATATA